MGRKNRSGERKKEILKVCYEVFAEEGFEKTTFVKVADRLNVTNPLIVHYFGTKENMILEMVDYMYRDQAEIISGLVKDIENPEERMNTVFDYYLGESFEKNFDDMVYYGCFYLSLKNSKIKKRFHRIIEHFDKVVFGEIKRYLQVTRKTHIDPDKIAFILDALIEGLDFLSAMEVAQRPRPERVKQIKEVLWKLLEEEDMVN
ncbi:TetR/AcrR family transcriptional regulator [Desulfobacula sp.]|uniref:TetR/AcrR family transcriptional regulator n=1 Tax=Desulfobacula sp. TaxID=2593537 RepID=UPI001EB6DB06|nr:TetR/AcrR family transcriptional regulator [Desulfobacula sp.]